MPSTQPTVLGLGEVLWDLLPTGPRLGGAPANFACLAKQLGASAAIISSVGVDQLGDKALQELQQRGINCTGISRVGHPTGTVPIEIDTQGQPTYEITEGFAWDHIPWSEKLANLAATTEVVCFGSLAQRSQTSRDTIQRFLANVRPEAWRIFDVNLRLRFYAEPIIRQSLELANVVKLNDEELPIVASLCGLSGSETEVMQQLVSRFNLQVVALTCGGKGAIFYAEKNFFRHPAVDTDVVDTVGAGDAYTAALACGLLAGYDWCTISSSACQLAAFVCSQIGATPTIPMDYLSLIANSDNLSS